MPSNEGVAAIGAAREPFKVLVLGGSYAGLAAALNLQDLCAGRSHRFAVTPTTIPGPKFPVKISLVDERDGYFHLIGSPLALASEAFQTKAWRKFRDIPALKEVDIIRGSVSKVDTKQRKATIVDKDTGAVTEKSYDFLVAATGLRRAWPVVPQSLTREDYLKETQDHIDQVKNANEGVVVIGGGAVGIEMAAEIKLIMPHQKVTLIHSRNNLLSNEPLPDEFKEQSAIELSKTGVNLVLGRRVLESTTNGSTTELKLDNGESILAGKVIYAISKSIPSTGYMPPATLNDQGYVKVTSSLNLLPETPNSQYHFAAGDIAQWSGIKRCGTAMHMGQYVASNIYATMQSQVSGAKPQCMELDDIPPMMGIAIGKTAVGYHPTTGVKHGEEQLKGLFGDDLGDTICWNYLQLGTEATPAISNGDS